MATTSSCAARTPDTPIAPMILPSTTIGTPPCKAVALFTLKMRKPAPPAVLTHDKSIAVCLEGMFTRSTYAHVGLAWVIGGRVFVLEAVKPRLRIYPLSKYANFYLLGLNVLD